MLINNADDEGQGDTRTKNFRLFWRNKRREDAMIRRESALLEILALDIVISSPDLPAEINRYLYERSVELVSGKDVINATCLQHKLNLENSVVEMLLSMMEQEGLISPPDHVENRVVLDAGHARASSALSL